MSDLTDRLREWTRMVGYSFEPHELAPGLREAADRIDALETAIRTAAAELRAVHRQVPFPYDDGLCVECSPHRWPCDAELVARDLTKTLDP